MNARPSPRVLHHGGPGDALTVGEFSLISHTGATGGVVMVTGQQKRLTPVQLAFLEQLVRQALDDDGKHVSVRGFVSSAILICSLPWDTAHPSASHLKQLVRRMRKRLAGTRVEIEAMSGLGYRIVINGSLARAENSDI
jgi:hypothetical protein